MFDAVPEHENKTHRHPRVRRLYVRMALGGLPSAVEGSTTLLVRKIPSWLTDDEKESLLKHFGAKEVRVMSNRGKMVSLLVEG